MKLLHNQIKSCINHSGAFSSKTFFTLILILGINCFTFQTQLMAQEDCSGTIYTNSNGLGNPAILDPNGDGRISAGMNQDFPDNTTELTDFESLVSNNGCSCEVGWTRFEGATLEPDSDTQSGGSCNNSDIVSDADGGQDHAYYTIIDVDGDCSTTDDLMIVYRIRVADAAAGTFSFEVLINNDGKLADDPGETVVCCNKTINPGFEKEIQLSTGGGNAGVNVYDIDGIIGENNAATATFDLATHSQSAKACGTNPACGSPRQPVFYSFMLPIDQLGYADCSTAISDLSMVAVSSQSGNPVIMDCNSTADVGGVDNNADNSMCSGFSCPNSCSAARCAEGATLLCAAGGFSTPLPVELVYFTAVEREENASLKWQTASEENNAGFEIEHSTNGRNFETIGFVNGKGTTAITANYTFVDNKPFFGDNYYRLKQVDFDGHYEYSDIVNLRFSISNNELASVFPNPNQGQFKLTVYNPKHLNSSIKLFDSTGQLIHAEDLEETQHTTNWVRDFDLPKRDIYFVVVQVGVQMFTKKVYINDMK